MMTFTTDIYYIYNSKSCFFEIFRWSELDEVTSEKKMCEDRIAGCDDSGTQAPPSPPLKPRFPASDLTARVAPSLSVVAVASRSL